MASGGTCSSTKRPSGPVSASGESGATGRFGESPRRPSSARIGDRGRPRRASRVDQYGLKDVRTRRPGLGGRTAEIATTVVGELRRRTANCRRWRESPVSAGSRPGYFLEPRLSRSRGFGFLILCRSLPSKAAVRRLVRVTLATNADILPRFAPTRFQLAERGCVRDADPRPAHLGHARRQLSPQSRDPPASSCQRADPSLPLELLQHHVRAEHRVHLPDLHSSARTVSLPRNMGPPKISKSTVIVATPERGRAQAKHGRISR